MYWVGRLSAIICIIVGSGVFLRGTRLPWGQAALAGAITLAALRWQPEFLTVAALAANGWVAFLCLPLLSDVDVMNAERAILGGLILILMAVNFIGLIALRPASRASKKPSDGQEKESEAEDPRERSAVDKGHDENEQP